MALVSLKSNLSRMDNVAYHSDPNLSIHSVEKLAQDNTHFTDHTLWAKKGTITIYDTSTSIHSSDDGLTHKIDDVLHIAAGSMRKGFIGNIPALGSFGIGQSYNNALLGIVSPIINITGEQTFPSNYITIGAVGSSIASPSPEPSNATIFKAQTFDVRNITITGDKIFNQKTDEDWLNTYYAQAKNENETLGFRNRIHNPTKAFAAKWSAPYVIRDVGERWGSGFDVTDTFVRGGIVTQISRTAADFDRLSKFAISPSGIGFASKQVILNLFNVRKEQKIWNPLSIAASIVPTVHMDRHISFGSIDDNGRYIQVKRISNMASTLKISSMGEGSSPNYSGIELPSFVEVVKGFIKKIDTKYITPAVDQINIIPYGRDSLGTGVKAETHDLIPFKIRDMTNKKWLVFRAILSGISDNISADWNEYKYIGRPDKMWTYQGATRTVSFTLSIFPKTFQELPVLYDKVNYLIGLCYPHWSGKGSSQRMTGPFVELTMGDLWKNTPGFFTSIDVGVVDNSPWEIRQHFKLPKHLEIGFNFTYIGNYLPNAQGKHYELDWLQDKTGNGTGTFKNGNPFRGGAKNIEKSDNIDLRNLFDELEKKSTGIAFNKLSSIIQGL